MYWVNNDANTVNDDTTYTAVPGGTRVSLLSSQVALDTPLTDGLLCHLPMFESSTTS
jgi:hypothetical protein